MIDFEFFIAPFPPSPPDYQRVTWEFRGSSYCGEFATSVKIDDFFTLFVRNKDKIGVKALEKNISRHKNGTLYLRVRKNGKLFTKSLQTKDLKEARRKVEAEGLDSFMIPQAAREPAATALPSPPVPLPVAVEAKAGVVRVTLKEALALHDARMIHLSKGREEITYQTSYRIPGRAARLGRPAHFYSVADNFTFRGCSPRIFCRFCAAILL